MDYALQRTVVDLALEPDFVLGRIKVCPSTREVIIDSECQVLAPRVMQVLVALARSRGEVVSHDELFRVCWQGRIVGDDAIHRCISRLRKLPDAGRTFSIEAIPRVGYRLKEIPAAQQPAPAAQTVIAPHTRTWLSGRHTLAAVLATAVLVAAAGISYWLARKPVAVIDVTTPHVPTVAVLPFTPLYSAKDAQGYGDAVANAVVDALSTTDLKVISPARSFQFRGQSKARAGTVLHADLLIDGEVRIIADKVSVLARVESVRYGITLYSHVYERSLTHIADVPDQVAAGMAGAIGSDVQVTVLSDPNIRDPALLADFLRLPDWWAINITDPFGSYILAKRLVQAAPDSALTQSLFATEAGNASFSVPQNERRALRAAAQAAAEKAIKLDPHVGESYYALAVLAAPDRAKEDALLQKAIAVNPESMNMAAGYGGFLAGHGRTQEGMQLMQKAVDRFAYAHWAVNQQLWTLFPLGRFDDAQKLALRARRLWPEWGHPIALFDAAVFQGDYDGADAVLRDPEMGAMLRPMGSPPVFPDIARAMRSRRPADIDAMVRDCMAVKPDDWLNQQPCVVALNMLGRLDAAFHLPDGWNFYSQMIYWPQTAPMRADPRFVTLTKKLGHYDYWRATHTRPDFCATEDVPVCRALAAK